jgi:Fe-S cluster assembly scaffold protein SufB
MISLQLLGFIRMIDEQTSICKLLQRTVVKGFIHAGRVLAIVSHEDSVDVMEQAHSKVFGESIAAQKNRKASLKEAVANGDDYFINMPACERLKP